MYGPPGVIGQIFTDNGIEQVLHGSSIYLRTQMVLNGSPTFTDLFTYTPATYISVTLENNRGSITIKVNNNTTTFLKSFNNAYFKVGTYIFHQLPPVESKVLVRNLLLEYL